jgi:hypothetical protein
MKKRYYQIATHFVNNNRTIKHSTFAYVHTDAIGKELQKHGVDLEGKRASQSYEYNLPAQIDGDDLFFPFVTYCEVSKELFDLRLAVGLSVLGQRSELPKPIGQVKITDTVTGESTISNTYDADAVLDTWKAQAMKASIYGTIPPRGRKSGKHCIFGVR